MRVLVSQLYERGGAKEVHVRVACPPIIAPCFYGIDMSRVRELFAPTFLREGVLTSEAEVAMARELGASDTALPAGRDNRRVDPGRASRALPSLY